MGVMKNDVNVSKSTVKLVKMNETQYSLEFTFDASQKCRLSIYLCAFESKNTYNVPTFFHTPTSLKQDFKFDYEAGQKQEFKGGLCVVDLNALSKFNITNHSKDHFPCIINLEGVYDRQEGQPMRQNAVLTYCVFVKEGSGLGIRVVKQKIVNNGNAFEMKEIYGLQDAMKGEVEDDGKECIICLTNNKNTIMMPCGHLCVCDECAIPIAKSTKQCPVCRAPITSTVPVNVDQFK